MKVTPLFCLFLFTIFKLSAQEKKAPLTPYAPNINSTGVVGCSIFTDPANYTCGSSFTYPAGVNDYQYTLSSGANSGCLATTPNQIWFIVTITSTTSNTMTFTELNSSNVDVDAAIWGPIANNDVANACSSTLNAPLSCDYRVNAEAVLTLTNAVVGQKYVMVVTNYSNSNTNISINQPTGGTVEYCKSNDIYNCQGSVPTASLTGNQTLCNTNTANLTVNFTGNAPWTYTINNGVGTATTSTNPLTIPVSPNVTTTYSLTALSNNCGTGTYTNNATVTVNNARATLSGNQTICNGSSANLTLNFTGTAPWTYTINNGVGTGTTSTNPLTIPVSPTVTTTYNVTALSNSCGLGTFVNNATVTVRQPATASLSGNQTICNGSSANLTLNFTGTGPWTYTIDNGIGTATTFTNPALISVSPSSTTTYNITVLSNTCGSGTITNNATISVNQPVSATLSGNQTICNGSLANLTLTLTGTTPWTYTINNGIGTTTTSANSLTIPVSPTTATDYKITALSNICGSGTYTNNAIVNVNQPVTANLSGNQTICDGSSGDLNLNFTGTAPYTYTIDNGIGTGTISTSPLVIQVSPATSTTYSITALSNACGVGTFSNNAVITVKQPTTATLTGNQTICNGSSGNLTLNFTGTSPWTYSVSNDGGSGTTSTNPLVIPVSPTVNTTYRVNSISNLCGFGTFTNDAAVVVNQTPTATLSGNNTICEGNVVNLTASFTGAKPITYTIDNGIGTATTSANGISIPVTPTSTTAYSITSISNLCGTGTFTNNAVVTVNQPANLSFGADQAICSGGSANLTLNFTGNAPWTYSMNNGIGTATTATSPVIIPVSPAYTTTYTAATVSNLCGTGTITGQTKVTVNNTPTATLSGNQAICSGNTGNLTLNFTGTAPWTYSINNIGTATTSTNPLNISISPTTTTTYNITALSNLCGVGTFPNPGTFTNDATITVRNPVTSSTLSGNQSICSGQAANLILNFTGTAPWTYTIDNGGGTATTYTNPLTVNVRPSDTTTYTLTSVSNICGTASVPPTNAVVSVIQKGSSFLTSTISDTVCKNTIVPLRLDFNGLPPYNYSVGQVSQSPSLVGSSSTSPVFLQVAPANTTNYAIVYTTDLCGTTNTTSNAQVLVHPNVSVITSGGGDINYPDDSVSVKLKFVGKAPWNYQLTTFPLQTTTIDSVIFKVSPQFSSNYSVGFISDYCGSGWGSGTLAVVNVCRKPIVGIVGHGNSLSPGSIPLSVRGAGNINLKFVGDSYTTGVSQAYTTSIFAYRETPRLFEIESVQNSCGFGIVTDGSWLIRNGDLLNRKLISCFPFDGNTNDSKSENTLVSIGSPVLSTDRFGVQNKSYSFNGASDFIQYTNNQLRTNEFTLSLWIYNDNKNSTGKKTFFSTGGLRTLWVQNDPTNPDEFFIYYGEKSSYSAPQTTFNTKSTKFNKWVHIVITRKRNGFKFLVDNELIYSTGNISPPYENISNILLGTNDQNYGSEYFKGKIDDVKFFSSFLSEDEITALYLEESCDFEYQENRNVELVACYPLDGNANESGSLLNGSTTNVVNAPNRLNTANTALSFDGTSSSITLPAEVIPNQLVEYSASAWVKINNYPTGVNKGTIFSMGGGVSEQTVYINSSGNVLFHSAGSNNVQPLTSFSPIPLSTWVHITVVRSGNEDILYINGQLSAKQDHISSVDYSNDRSALIGNSVNGNSFFSGIIDDVKLFEGAMYKGEVMALYQSTGCAFTKCPPILTYSNPTDSPLTLSASKQISSSSKLNALPVEYSSSGSIELNPGFEVSNGNYFKAHIGGCPSN